MNYNMTDIHMHLIPGVDDGAVDLDMAMEMLQQAHDQGIRTVFATPHSSAFDDWQEETAKRFQILRSRAKLEFRDMQIFPGCEVFCHPACMEDVLCALESGKYPMMNETNYVLIEFSTRIRPQGITECAQTLINKGWKPIIAHMERYRYLWNLPELVDTLREMGCLIQINAYSLSGEQNDALKAWARWLAVQKKVDFLGTDAHRTDHRPPSAEMGLGWLYENAEQDYADAIAWGNAWKTLQV